MTALVIASRNAASRVARLSSGWGSGALRWRLVLARDLGFGWGIVLLRWTRRTLAPGPQRGGRFELARVVVEGVQQQLLGPGVDERAQFPGAVLGRAVDGAALGHPRAGVHAVEDGAQALEGRGAVLLDREVDALGLRDRPAGLGELLVEDLGLLDEVLRGGGP